MLYTGVLMTMLPSLTFGGTPPPLLSINQNFSNTKVLIMLVAIVAAGLLSMSLFVTL